MKRYIDAEELINNLNEFAPESFNALINSLILKQPTADVQEVKHGKWEKAMPRRKGRNATYRCSCCGQLRSSYYNDVQNWEYCPCGAKMDKE